MSEKKKRSQHSKSRYGCLTCRIRKIKCDETQPACRQCVDTGRICEGPSAYRLTFVEPYRTSPVDDFTRSIRKRTISPLPQSHDVSQIRSFDLFIHHVAPSLAGCLDAEFWRVLVPQLGQSNPVIWNAILAISCLFEGIQQGRLPTSATLPSPIAKSSHWQVWRWYNKSLRSFHPSPGQDSEKRLVALVSCILFVSIEFQQYNATNAAGLLRSASIILSPDSRTAKSQITVPSSIEKAVVPILVRQSAHIALFGQPTSAEWRNWIKQHLIPSPKTQVSSLFDARTEIYLLLDRGSELMQQAFFSRHDTAQCEPLASRRLDLLEALDGWHAMFTRFRSEHESRMSPLEKYVCSCLMMYHGSFKIWISTSLDPMEIAFDNYVESFANIIRHGETAIEALGQSYALPPAYSIEMGVIPPLYFTAWKCRDPLIRRAAVELLRQAPPQEGLFGAESYARGCEKIIEIEERELKLYPLFEEQASLLPPENSRLLDTGIMWEIGQRKMAYPSLVYWRTEAPEIAIKIPLG